jgi:FlaA1/EpsC-like NDP-sugar epimerase
LNYQKQVLMWVLLDLVIILASISVGHFTLHPYLNIHIYRDFVTSFIVLLISYYLFAFRIRLYQKAWEHASIGEVIIIIKTVTFSIITTAIIQIIINNNVYIRVLGITWMIHIILICGSRVSLKIYKDYYMRSQTKKKLTLIIGAGSAGTMLARQLIKSRNTELHPVGFIDDDSKKEKLHIYGVPVLGKIKDIPILVKKLKVENIIIAIPSLNKKEIQKIYQVCSKTASNTQILPMIEDIVSGKVSVNQLREVRVEDLLGREPIQLDIESISKTINGKNILVTGAGGSIGSEICRQVSKFKPKKLLLLGHGENSIYQIDMELKNTHGNAVEIIPIIADIQDRDRIFEIMSVHVPDVVYHTAAHKHVPLMECNPKEAVKNNIIGTKNVAEAADMFGVTTFVLVSSDKAVNPTKIIGSTKRIAEMVIQQLDKKSKTNYIAVRFGNVLGSRGSVIPLFKKQIQSGGPITVTHPEMIRYFMTIPEASRLVIQAGALANGGEIFVLDMGEPVKILELAKNLIQLSGYTVEEIGIKYSGIRSGEKMYEELLGKDEVHNKAVFPNIFIGKTVEFDYNKVSNLIDNYNAFEHQYICKYLLQLANKKEKLLVSKVH